jgi:putative ABC transport system permease protein
MIKLINVSKYYKTEAGVSVGLVKANLEFNVGEFVAVVGESGSGKTTLLNVISGLDTYEDGEMYLFGEPTSHYEIEDLEKYRSTYVGFVFQNYNIIDSYTVTQNIILALELQGYPKDKIKSRALELIERVGLTHRKNHKAAKLSGGEKQRVVIARALAKDCPIIVADEPTGNLDSKSGAEVMKLLDEVSKDKLVIVVSHNYEEVKPYATRRVKIHDGQIVEDIKIKHVPQVEDIVKPEIKEFTTKQTFKWSLMDLFSRPKRFIFLFITQLAVMLLFSLTYAGGQAIVNEIDNLNTDMWFSRNMYTENRIGVQRHDGAPISEAELNSFKSNPNVVSVAKSNMLFFDSNNSLRLAPLDGENRSVGISGVSHNTIFSKGKGELISGKPAQAVNEVILSSDLRALFKVNEEIYLMVPGQTWDAANEKIKIKVTGFSKDKKGILYLDERFGTPNNLGFKFFVNEVAKNSNLYINGTPNKLSYTNYESVEPVDFLIPSPLVDNATVLEVKDQNKSYYNLSLADTKYVSNNDVYEISITYNKLSEIAETVYNDQYEIALIVNDKIDADLVISSLDKTVYQIRTFSPTEGDGILLLKQIVSVIIFGGALLNLLFLYAILGLVIRNSMNARKKDFAIFRSIGTNEKTIGQLVIFQQILISLFAYIGLMTIVTILNIFVPASFIDFRMIGWHHYLILFILFMLFSIWLGFRFNKRIFKITVIKNLQIEEVI